jgi:phenol 2-monooxygenase
MIVPREGDLVRLYVQIAEIELGGTGRMDRTKMTPEKIMEVSLSLASGAISHRR